MPGPKPSKPPQPPKPWRRDDGRYRSADDRFTIEGGGAGRWYLTDGESLDELGLARTLGPYGTLDDAKAAAADRRGKDADASPLAARIEAAKDRPARAASPRPKAKPKLDVGDDAGVEPVPELEPPAPPRTWLDELEDEDAAAAARARRLVDQLAALGVPDAVGVVRRDVLGRQPAIAAELLGRTLADALRTALDPASLAGEARSAIPGPLRELKGVDEASLAAYAALVAARVLAATLDVVAGQDRAAGAGRDLPGWRLVERPAASDGDGAPRRLIVTPEDVPGA